MQKHLKPTPYVIAVRTMIYLERSTWALPVLGFCLGFCGVAAVA